MAAPENGMVSDSVDLGEMVNQTRYSLLPAGRYYPPGNCVIFNCVILKLHNPYLHKTMGLSRQEYSSTGRKASPATDQPATITYRQAAMASPGMEW